jgi:hypothetical protein
MIKDKVLEEHKKRWKLHCNDDKIMPTYISFFVDYFVDRAIDDTEKLTNEECESRFLNSGIVKGLIDKARADERTICEKEFSDRQWKDRKCDIEHCDMLIQTEIFERKKGHDEAIAEVKTKIDGKIGELTDNKERLLEAIVKCKIKVLTDLKESLNHAHTVSLGCEEAKVQIGVEPQNSNSLSRGRGGERTSPTSLLKKGDAEK